MLHAYIMAYLQRADVSVQPHPKSRSKTTLWQCIYVLRLNSAQGDAGYKCAARLCSML